MTLSVGDQMNYSFFPELHEGEDSLLHPILDDEI